MYGGGCYERAGGVYDLGGWLVRTRSRWLWEDGKSRHGNLTGECVGGNALDVPAEYMQERTCATPERRLGVCSKT